ncbi:MAG: YbaY family lipoprotein [Marmoricola sp.]
MAHVSVQIEWPTGLEELPPDARAQVTVEDATLADASSVVIAETVLADLDLARPAVADLEVGEVDPAANLVVRVQVTPGSRKALGIERGDLITTQAHPVLTRGHGDSVVVPLTRVGS